MASKKPFVVKHGLEVSGNTDVTGTLTAASVEASNGQSFVTQDQLTTEVNNLVDSAPGALDTLNELAAAMGDDANFATTVTTNLGQKLGATASVTLTGDATGSGSFSSNAVSITTTVSDLANKLDTADLLTEIQSIDGATSGIDADLLDGQHGSYYRSWDNATNKPSPTVTLSGDVSGSATMTELGSATITTTIADDSHNHTISNVDGLQTALDAKLAASSYTASDVLTKIKTVDGAGSGLDADLLDGQSSAYYATAASVTSEASTRGSADTTLQNNIDSEASTRASADSALWSGITATNTAVRAYTDTAITNLIGGAPGALDTLNELAAAINDDASYASTITTQLGSKLDASHDMSLTLSGDASGSATFTNMGDATLSVTVADDSHNHVISNVDGLQTALDGKLATTHDMSLTLSGDVSGSATFTNMGDATLSVTVADDSHNHTIANVDGLQTALDGKTTTARTITAGTGLSGGGNLTANRTINVNADLRAWGTGTDVYWGNTHDFVFADADIGLRFYTAGAEDMRLQDGGNLHVDGDVIAYSTTISDERLKENVEVVSDAVSKVQQLRGVTFTYKKDGRESAGIIAQDVEKVLPQAVTEMELPFKAPEGEEYKTVCYDALHALLIESIKELKSEIEELKAKS